MEENNGREDKPTRGVVVKGVVMATMRSMGGMRDTRTRGK